MSEKESLEKYLIYQQDLRAEEECLKKIISKLNAQVHALQVEQLHILNAMSKTSSTNENHEEPKMNETVKKEFVDPEKQELNLSIPKYQSSEEDEDEFED